MKAIDTNILVRFLVRDDEAQADKTRKRFKAAETNKDPLFVPNLVVLETIWMLEKVYEVERNMILISISNLLSMPSLMFESQTAIHNFIRSAEDSRYDLSDLLIAHSAHQSGCESTLTFDKKASKFALFEML